MRNNNQNHKMGSIKDKGSVYLLLDHIVLLV